MIGGMQMSRKNFVEVLQSAKIDLDKEYDRLYALFYGKSNDILEQNNDAKRKL